MQYIMADDENIKRIRFTADTSSPIHESHKKYQATAKYDRKTLNKRLAVEEYMHYQLQELYNCKEGEEYNVEIDIDQLLLLKKDEERAEAVQKILKEAPQSTEKFISELLLKIKELNIMSPPSTVATEEMNI